MRVLGQTDFIFWLGIFAKNRLVLTSPFYNDHILTIFSTEKLQQLSHERLTVRLVLHIPVCSFGKLISSFLLWRIPIANSLCRKTFYVNQGNFVDSTVLNNRKDVKSLHRPRFWYECPIRKNLLSHDNFRFVLPHRISCTIDHPNIKPIRIKNWTETHYLNQDFVFKYHSKKLLVMVKIKIPSIICFAMIIFQSVLGETVYTLRLVFKKLLGLISRFTSIVWKTYLANWERLLWMHTTMNWLYTREFAKLMLHVTVQSYGIERCL